MTSLDEKFYIQNASRFEGREATAKGWVYNSRSSGKIRFLMLRDGTGLMQCVLFKGDCDEQSFAAFDSLTQESAVEVTGILRKRAALARRI